MFLANPFRLRETGLLGMNERNTFIARYNQRRLYPASTAWAASPTWR